MLRRNRPTNPRYGVGEALHARANVEVAAAGAGRALALRAEPVSIKVGRSRWSGSSHEWPGTPNDVTRMGRETANATATRLPMEPSEAWLPAS